MIKFWNRHAGDQSVVTASRAQAGDDRSMQFNSDAVHPLTQEEIDTILRQIRATRQGRRSDIHLRRKIMQREAETAHN